MLERQCRNPSIILRYWPTFSTQLSPAINTWDIEFIPSNLLEFRFDQISGWEGDLPHVLDQISHRFTGRFLNAAGKIQDALLRLRLKLLKHIQSDRVEWRSSGSPFPRSTG